MWEFVGQNHYFYKLNANCRQEEKQGEGPGSYGGNRKRDMTVEEYDGVV